MSKHSALPGRISAYNYYPNVIINSTPVTFRGLPVWMVILAVTERFMTLAKGVAGIGGFRGGFLGKGKIELKHGGGYKGHVIVLRC